MRLLIAVIAFVFIAAHPALARDEYRALWVDVFHPGMRTPAEIDTMLQVARAANYNAVIVQVRKACDAYYNSYVEPRNPDIVRIDPGFDPLAYIIRRAHDTSGGQRRLEVHAWLVTYRCRMPNDDSYLDRRHVFNKHPEWLSQMYDGSNSDKGENQGKYYLDPGVPQVSDYTLEVVRDILAHYDVDGIHFDYVRYPESKGGGNQWGYNPTAVARFDALYHRLGKPAPDDPQWCEFRRQQVSYMMRKVYAHVRAWRPRVKVSAACIAWDNVSRGFEQSEPFKQVMQDWPGMARDGFLDMMIPMNYKREAVTAQAADHRQWASFLGNVALQSGRFGVNGVDGEALNTLPGILAQMQATRELGGVAGIATYCYAEARKGSTQIPDVEFFNTIRTQAYQNPAQIPDAHWLTHPSEGLIKGIVTSHGKLMDGAQVQLDGARPTTTDGSGFYAFARVRPGAHTVLVAGVGQVTAQVSAGGVAEAAIAGK